MNFKETIDFCYNSMNEIFSQISELLQTMNSALDENSGRPEFLRNGNIIKLFPERFSPTSADLQLNNGKSENIKAIPNSENKENEEMPKIPYLHIYKRKNGYFQAVYYGNGNRKCWTNKSRAELLKTAKDFIAIDKKKFGSKIAAQNFNSLCELWLNTLKKPFVSGVYFKTLISAYRYHVKPFFKGKSVKIITPIILQAYFSDLYEKSSRVTETVKTIVSGVLEYAVGNGIILTNPMRAVVVERHERKNGRELSYDELKLFREDIKSRKTYRLPFLIFLYTGVRRSEYPSLEFDFDSGFVRVKNSKLKKHQKRDSANLYRELPILPALREFRAEIEAGAWKTVYLDELAKEFPKIVPGGKLSWLRHTFQTYCCKFAKTEMVDFWSGHVVGNTTTSKIYLHFPKEDQLKIADKIEY